MIGGYGVSALWGLGGVPSGTGKARFASWLRASAGLAAIFLGGRGLFAADFSGG